MIGDKKIQITFEGGDGVKLVKVEKDGCRPCQQLALELHAYKDELGELDITVETVNISKSPDAIDVFDVMSVPTLIIFKDGEEKKREIGFVPGMKVIEMIKEVLEEK